MKIIKSAIAAMFFLIAIILTSELYLGYSSDFCDYGYVTIVGETDKSIENEVYSTLESADKLGLEPFVALTDCDAALHMDVEIYCDKEIKEKLEADGHKEGEFYSLISGKSSVEYLDVKDFAALKHYKKTVNIYFLADDLNVLSREEIIVQNSEYIPYMNIIYSIWGICLLILLLVNLVDTLYRRKEIFVKITLGHKLSRVLGYQCIRMMGELLVALALALLIMRRYIVWHVLIKLIPLAILFVLAMFLIMFVPFINMNGKKVLSDIKKSRAFLVGGYILRMAIIVLLIMVIAFGISVFNGYAKLKNQEDDFLNYKGYYKLSMIDYESYEEEYTEENFKYRTDFIKMHYEDYLLCNELEYVTIGTETKGVYYVNKKASFSVEPIIKKEGFALEDDKVYILAHTNDIGGFKEKYDMMLAPDNINAMAMGAEIEWLEYKNDACILGLIPFESMFEVKKNPLIIYFPGENYEVDFESLVLMEAYSAGYVSIPEKEIYEYVHSYSEIDDYGFTSIYDNYKEKLAIQEKTLQIWLGIVLVMILLEIVVTATVLQIENSMNSVEKSVMKINGAPLIIRYLETLICSILAGILAVIITINIEAIQIGNMGVLVVGAVILAVDILHLILCISRWERANLIKTLKGGSL